MLNSPAAATRGSGPKVVVVCGSSDLRALPDFSALNPPAPPSAEEEAKVPIHLAAVGDTRGLTLVRELRESSRVMVRHDRRPPEMRFSLKEIARRSAAEAERQAIHLVLRATQGNKSEAARLLSVDYKTLYLKMKRYGIDADEFRAP